MQPITHRDLPPAGRRSPNRGRRLVRLLVRAFRDANAAQQVVFENYLRIDGYLLEPPAPRHLHWEPTMPGRELRGQHLPPTADGTRQQCGQ